MKEKNQKIEKSKEKILKELLKPEILAVFKRLRDK